MRGCMWRAPDRGSWFIIDLTCERSLPGVDSAWRSMSSVQSMSSVRQWGDLHACRGTASRFRLGLSGARGQFNLSVDRCAQITSSMFAFLCERPPLAPLARQYHARLRSLIYYCWQQPRFQVWDVDFEMRGCMWRAPTYSSILTCVTGWMHERGVLVAGVLNARRSRWVFLHACTSPVSLFGSRLSTRCPLEDQFECWSIRSNRILDVRFLCGRASLPAAYPD